MTIQDYGSIGELVAAFATIATLGYLAVQIRHSTKAARRGALHDVVVCSQAVRSHYISNPDVAALYLRGLADPKQLSPEDAIRFQSLMLSSFENAREYYEVYQSGDFSKEEWAFCRGHLAELLAQSVLKGFLERIIAPYPWQRQNRDQVGE